VLKMGLVLPTLASGRFADRQSARVGQFFRHHVATPLAAMVPVTAASQDILDLGRCNGNAPELVSLTYAPDLMARFSIIHFS
jgi:hypothetical protein